MLLEEILDIWEIIKKKRSTASLTIEAAMILPIFLFGMFTLISLFSVLRCDIAMEESVCLMALSIAKSAAIEWGIESYEISSKLCEFLGEEYSELLPIEGGFESIDYSGTDISNHELLILNVKYESRLPFDSLNLFHREASNGIVVHTWIGFENGLDGLNSNYYEEYVYVTEYGTVYHRDRNCSHIMLSVRETRYNRINELRNSGGHKYYPCEQCRPDSKSAHIYITEDGDRFHGSLNCSGLKRTIYTKKLSEIGNMRECSKCGKYYKDGKNYSWSY